MPISLIVICILVVLVLGYALARSRSRSSSARNSRVGPQRLAPGEEVPDGHIDTTGLSKAEVLAALFNTSAPAGMGFLQASDGPQVMTVDDAQALIDGGNAATNDYGGKSRPGYSSLYFDYVFGRPLKIDLTDDGHFYPGGFDRDNGGDGTAQRVIDELRATEDVNPHSSQRKNDEAARRNVRDAMAMAGTSSTRRGNHLHLGADEMGEPLEKAVQSELDRLKGK